MTRLILNTLTALLIVALTACAGNKTVGERVDDSVITSKIEAKLTADPEVSAFKVDVDTDEGVVRLSGTVDTQRARSEAADLARNTQGVRKVINDIVVGELSAGERLDDAGITVRVKAKLAADPEVNPFEIDVDTDGGIVSLSGTVKTKKVKKEAGDLARSVKGVTKVKNLLKVAND